MKRITIIGGGASGTLLAANILKLSNATPVTVNLVDKRERLGLGIAYATSKDTHLLNVPANKMGAFPDDVEHFHRWLSENGYEYDDHAFVPRRIFGEYLKAVLRQASKQRPPHVVLNIIEDEAADIDIGERETRITLAGGDSIVTDKTVLAFGNFLPPHPSVEGEDFRAAEKYFQNPWDQRIYDILTPEDSVLIIGTGLTMIDLALHLDRSGHKGKISAISTRGLLPAVHSLGHTYPAFHDELRSQTRITDLLKIVRKHIDAAASQGLDWRGVIDSLRPVTQDIWLELPTPEKKYFMQHLSRYWNVARHRMPPEAAAVLETMQQDGRLEILKGRLKRIDTRDNKFYVTYRADDIEKQLETTAVINCIGSESNFERLDSPLVRSMFSKGYLQNDAVSLGVAALPNGAIVGKNGFIPESVWTLGTALKGILWESTAIPEIRTQARRLAERLLAD